MDDHEGEEQSAATELFVGVECNRTATTVVIRDAGGEYLGQTVGPGASVSTGGVQEVADAIASTIGTALAAAGAVPADVRAVYAGVAGVGRDQERFGLWRALSKHDLARDIAVQPDAAIAMHDAFDESPGILLIVGSGSIAYGRTKAGDCMRCGGWGAIAGDEGSGAWLGRQLLSEITSMADGRVAMTPLYDRVLAEAKVASTTDLLAWSWKADARDLALLARVIAPAAREGDASAVRMLEAASAHLVRLVTTLIPRIGEPHVAVAFCGEWMAEGEPLRAIVIAELERGAPIRIEGSEVVPARGAAELAYRLAQGQAVIPRVDYTYAAKT